MVFAWNGREFQFISDVLGVAPLGASSGDGSYFPVDPDEYLQLPPGTLAPRNGRYEIRITEELHEVSYIDQARLIAVDHPPGIEIFTNDKFKGPPFPEFRLFGVERRIYPAAARDGHGRDVRAALLGRDRVYAAGFRHDMAGTAEMHALELDFPAGAARQNRAVLILNGWIDWADGSTLLVRVADDRFVIMGSGDELNLSFDAGRLPAVPPGWKRDFLLLVDGWSKDADANTAFADSVEPLPFHGMSRYPHLDSERFPDDAAHRAWRAEYNTRREMRLIERLAGL